MGSGSLAKIRHNSVGGAVAKFALSFIYCVVHLMQNWKTKLCIGEKSMQAGSAAREPFSYFFS